MQVGKVDKAIYVQTMFVNVLKDWGDCCAAPTLDIKRINDVALAIVMYLADACVSDNHGHAFWR